MKALNSIYLVTTLLVLNACDLSTDFNQPKIVLNLIRNNILLQEKGLHVTWAYLSDDKGNFIDDNNLIQLNEPLNLHLFIDSGWRERNGRIRFGAAQ